VRFFGDGVRTQPPLMTLSTRRVRVIDSIHLSKRADVKVRFF
jgi:fructose-1,6-bisphosphatase/sedoheptulose 1,7-bisphosphatase-like protein